MKTILYLLFLGLFLCCNACQDEDLIAVSGNESSYGATTRGVVQTSALVKNSDGYWVANKRRIPLVGEGRIVDNFSNAVVGVLADQKGLKNMIDLDITNFTSFDGVANVQAITNQIVSVKDLHRAYAGEQEAGFVYKIDNSSLLTLDLLKGFYIETFLNGKSQEKKGGNTSGETLELTLLSAVSKEGTQALSLSTSLGKPFDEVRLGTAGVSADVAKALKLYYAFVGETPIKECVRSKFPNVELHTNTILDLNWTSSLWVGTSGLVDENLSNGPTLEVIGGLTGRFCTVNMGEIIPTGSEVGFAMTGVTVLSLGLLSGTKLTTYDATNNEVESMTISDVLGLSLLGGGKRQVSMVTTKPCSQVKLTFGALNVNLGATVVNYAFVRDPIEIDASSYLSFGNTEISGNSYQFSNPGAGTMSYVIKSHPNGAVPQIEGNKMTGMTVNGSYVIEVTYTEGDKSYVQEVTIVRNSAAIGDNCNNLITQKDNQVYTYLPGMSGLLVSNAWKGNIDNILDANPDNYITHIDVLTLLENTGLIGIAAPTAKPISNGGQKIRTGFIIQPTATLLGADVLKFFRIRLLRNGQYIDGGLADENTIVNAGLIGGSGDKVRVSITTDQAFDAMELWLTQIANVNLGLSEFRLFGAFWEPESANCTIGNLPDACLELMTADSYGAEINYDATKAPSLANVASSFNNLGNLLDNDKTTSTLITNTTVAGEVVLAVKFDPLTANQQMGFIMKNITGVADVDLLKWFSLSLWNQGIKVAETTGSGGLLGLGVIGYGGDVYYSITTPSVVNEIRIAFIGVAQALENVAVAGLFIRPDTDGDGVPDCSEEDPGTNKIEKAVASPEHICLGQEVVIQLTGERLVAGTQYSLDLNQVKPVEKVTTITATLNDQKQLIVKDVPVGDYYVNIIDVNNENDYWNGVHITVHPKESTWKTNASSTDWNNWDNWTSGTPWDCTNVIIPSNASRYPLLAKGDNYCNYIHFETGAEVVKSHYLHYAQAWVDLGLVSKRYYMLSAPLKDMVTGDMFIPAAMAGVQNNDYFTSLDATSSPENRFNPRIYQRLWSTTAPGKKISGGTLVDVNVTVNETNWSKPFNALAYKYANANGFSLMIDNEKLSTASLVFRFPKNHPWYSYFNVTGTNTGMTENIARTSANTGRFVYEGTTGASTGSFKVTVTNEKNGDTFLVGNPFMAHINVDRFLAENTAVQAIKVYDGNKYNTLIKADGQLLSNGENFTSIAPMQSFFVVLADVAQSYTVAFTEDMQEQKPGTSGLLRGTRASTGSAHQVLNVTATTGGYSGSCILRIHPKASAAYRAKEDFEMLLDDQISPAIAVFSIAETKALDVQQLNDANRIPLGLYMRAAGPVTFTLNHSDSDTWTNWALVEESTGRKYPLLQSVTTVDAGIQATHVGRFYLEKMK